MYKARVALVEDPLLRRSLRKLYPDAPEWMQRLIIATPRRQLPAPSGLEHPAWDSKELAMAALTATCDEVNATHPAAPWGISSVVTIGGRKFEAGPTGWPAREEMSHTTTGYYHPAAEGRPIGFMAGVGAVFQLHIQTRGDTLFLTRQPGRANNWRMGYHGIRWNGVQQSSGDLFLAETNGGLSVFGDGTTGRLMTEQGRPHAWQYAYCNPTDSLTIDRLMRRWAALRSATDQWRIATFWVTHENPVLSTVGMQALATRQQTPPGRPRRAASIGGRPAAQDSGQDSGQDSALDSAQDSAQDSVRDPVHGAAQEAAQAAVPDTTQDPVPSSLAPSAHDPTSNPTRDPVSSGLRSTTSPQARQ
jgi:hypothetical protein